MITSQRRVVKMEQHFLKADNVYACVCVCVSIMYLLVSFLEKTTSSSVSTQTGAWRWQRKTLNYV